MKRALILLLNMGVVASAQITWNKVWPPVNNGTHNPPNGYEDILWDSYTGKVWIYSTNGTNSGDQIYSIRLHYFDPGAVSDTNIGDNGQTSGGGCFTSTAGWPYTHHTVGQFWVDAIRHRIYTIEGVGCTEEVLEQWYYQLGSPISGTSWTETFPAGLATSHKGEVGPWQCAWENTNVSASIGGSDTTMSVTNPAYAVNQDFYLIESEIVRITATGNPYLMGSGSGTGVNPLTITRGLYGTTAAPHSSGAVVQRLSGTFNNGKVVHDTYHDAFFWLGQRNDNSFGQLFVYCDTTQNPTVGMLTSAQSSVGCSRPDDWVDITSKSICADSTACTASAEAGANGTNSGKLPHGWYYPSMDFDPTSNTIIFFAGGIYQTQYQYSFVYNPATFIWTRLITTCSGPQCTGLLSIGLTSGGSGYTSAPAVTINNCSGATATASVTSGAVTGLTITNFGTSCSSPTVSFAGGGGSGATARATANTLNAPPVYSSNSENTRIAHAVFQGKMYYHLSQNLGQSLYSGAVEDWVLDPVAKTWTELQAGAGPSLTEAMTVDPATGNLYSWATPTSGTDAEIWQGRIGGTAAAAPSIVSTSPINSGTQSIAYSFSFAATGTGPISWNVISGGLPPGLTLNGSGALSGTPTSAGTYTFGVEATNSVGAAGPQTYSLTITAPSGSAPVITTTSPLPQGVQGSTYATTFNATGTTPVVWRASGLPAGLSMSSSGVVSGTPTQAGVSSIAVFASNSAGSVNGNFSLTVTASQGGPAPASPLGLGHSTYNCLDVDGDGYGVGPGCLGPDADDNDATVHTASDVLAKWGTLAAFWTHMGWSPTAVLYVDGGTGNCTPVSSPFTYSATTACSSIDAAISSMSAGQAVVLRGGVYSRSSAITFKPGNLNGSACTAYSYYLSYPGEQPDFEYGTSTNGSGVSGTQSCFVVDGLKLHQSCLANQTCGGGGYGVANSYTVYGMTLSHMDVAGFTDEIFIQYNQMGTQVVHNYIHDAYAGGDFGHDIYLGSNVTSSNGTTIQGNIITNAMQACIHANGPMSNITVDSNMIYGCDQPILFQSGISHSTVQNNAVHTSATALMELNTYANGYSTNPWQCHDENYNVIRNNTFFMDGQSYNASLVTGEDAGHAAIYVVDDGTCQTQASYTPDLGHNTYANNILVHNCGTNCVDYPGPIIRYSGSEASTYLQTDTWRNNLLYNFDVAARIIDPVGNNLNYQNCSWFTSPSNVPLGSGNICGSNPLFSAANPQWNTAPANWNLAVGSSSPALAAGLASNAPTYDILGTARHAVPTIGAYESFPLAPPSPCDLNGDGVVNAADFQIALNQALGLIACTNANLTGNGCNVVDVERVIDAAMGAACLTGP